MTKFTVRTLILVGASIAALAPAIPATAQYHTTPNIYGQPQYGTTTTGPNGQSCRTTPNIYGQPQLGSTTTCN